MTRNETALFLSNPSNFDGSLSLTFFEVPPGIRWVTSDCVQINIVSIFCTNVSKAVWFVPIVEILAILCPS